MGRPKVLGAILAVTAALTLAACGGTSTPAATVTTNPPTTAATQIAPTGGGAPAGSASNAALNQQVQNLNQSLAQVNGDLSSADKAIANGG
jgi:hypothetical protein